MYKVDPTTKRVVYIFQWEYLRWFTVGLFIGRLVGGL